MRKWEVIGGIILTLLGLGVMAGQGFEINGWVLLFWGAAILLGIVAWLHKEPSRPKGVIGDVEPGNGPVDSSTLAMLSRMGARFDSPTSGGRTRITREAVAGGRWGTWVAGKFVLDEPATLGHMAQAHDAVISHQVPDWVPSGSLVEIRYQVDGHGPVLLAIRRCRSHAAPHRLQGSGTVEVMVDERSRFEVATAPRDAIQMAGADEVAAFTLWVVGFTPYN